MEELLCKLVTMETSEEDVAREQVAREVVEKLVNDVVNDQLRITATCLFNNFIYFVQLNDTFAHIKAMGGSSLIFTS